MAKFTGDISDVKGTGGATANPSSFAQSKGSNASGLASLFSMGAQEFSRRADEKKTLDAGQAIGDAQTGILDLQDERNQLIQEDINIQNTIQDIHRDQTVTPEEQRTLDGLKKRQKFLEDARQSGALNETAFQTRMNSLQRQSLAAVQNLGIQSSIIGLFSQGRSSATTGVPKEQLEFQQEMDKTYGVGNWTAEDAGKRKAAALFNASALEKASVDVTSISINAPQVYSNMVDPALITVNKSINENGALLDEHADLFRASVIQQFTVANNQLNAIVNKIHADPTKTLSKEHLTSIQEARDNIRTQRDNYLSLLSDEGGKLGSAGVAKRIKQAADLQSDLTKLQNPALAAGVMGAVGSGKTSLIEWAGIIGNDQMLQTVISSLPPIQRNSTSVDLLRTQVASAITSSLSPTIVTIQDMINMGIVNKPLGRILSMKGIANMQTPEEVASMLSVFDDVDFNNIGESVSQLSNRGQLSSIKALQGPAKAEAQNKLRAIFSNYADAIGAELQARGDVRFSKDKATGKISIQKIGGGQMNRDNQIGAREERKVNNYLEMVRLYKDFVGFSPEEASQMILAEPFTAEREPPEEAIEDGTYTYRGRTYQVKGGVIVDG